MFITRTRAVGWLLISALFFVVFTVLAISRANTYVNGERLTAHVDRCETHTSYSRHGSHEVTNCYGTWKTADGADHSGEIDGADRSDEGSDIAIRTDGGDSAFVDSAWELWPIGVSAVALGFLVLSVFAVRRAWRRARSGVETATYTGPTAMKGGVGYMPPGASGPGAQQPPPGPPAYPRQGPAQPAFGQGPVAYPPPPGSPAPGYASQPAAGPAPGYAAQPPAGPAPGYAPQAPAGSAPGYAQPANGYPPQSPPAGYPPQGPPAGPPGYPPPAGYPGQPRYPGR